MAADIFLKIDGIEGESTDRFHKGEIEVLSYSWGLTNTGSNPSGGGGGTGKPVPQDFQFTHLVDKASAKLLLNCCNGRHISSALLSVRKSGREALDYIKYKLSDVVVSSVAPRFLKEDQGDAPIEQFALNFSKIEFTEVAGDGSVSQAVCDFRLHTSG